MEELPFHSVAVFGPGLLGGSIAHAVREKMPQCELRLWARRSQTLELARNLGLIEHGFTDPVEAARGAELIILATPIGAFEELARRMLPGISRTALVTDIGSVKAYVHRTTGQLLSSRGRFFIGSHPMAGAEKQGLEHAAATLLKGATVALTNAHGVEECMLARLADFWSTLGCRPYAMDPVNHDRTVARISHTPHILAGLCARNAIVGDTPLADLQRLAATGFRDTTRVCAGGASMWADILWENDVAIRETLGNCLEDLRHLIGLLENQDREGVHRWLEGARDTRELVRRRPG